MSLRCLVIGPLAEGKEATGEDAFVRSLLQHPPAGVEYVHYSRLLETGQGCRQKWIHRLFSFLSHIGYLHPAPWLETFSSQESFDLIHVHGFDVRLGGKIAEIPIILSTSSYGPVHCAQYLRWEEKRIARYHKRLQKVFRLLGIYDACNNLREAAALVVWSESARNFHLQAGVNPDRIQVIPPGIEIPSAAERSFSDTTEVLFVGTDFSRKGGDLLLQAWKQLRLPQARLTMIGGEAPDLPEGVEHHPYIAPEELKSRFYPRSHIFAFPTRAEGYGMVVLEAMAYGLAIVASRLGAISEMVADGKTGFLVQAGDVQDMSDRLAFLVNNPRIYREMGEAGRRRAAELFSVERRNTLLSAIYRKALEKSAVSRGARQWCKETG